MSRTQKHRLSDTVRAVRGLSLVVAVSGVVSSSQAASQSPPSSRLATGVSAPLQVAKVSRAALLVGISDYPGTDNDLGGGPLNDVALMSDLLTTRLGFSPANIVALTDADATPSNILDALLTRLAKVPPMGVVVVYFSGHGTQLPDLNGDEADGLDEVLVTRGDSAGTVDVLRDDDLGALAGLLRAGRILFILDNCYSGTGTRGVGRIADLATVAGSRAETLGLRRASDIRDRGYWPKRIAAAEFPSLPRVPSSSALASAAAGSEPTGHLLLAASLDNEMSVNLPLRLDDGSVVSVGLLTAALYGTLQSANMNTMSFSDLVASLRVITRKTTASMRLGPQTPQVEGAAKGQSVSSFLRVP